MSAGQVIQWHDLFVVIDDGSLTVGRYDSIETVMREQAKQFPQGFEFKNLGARGSHG